MQIFRLTAVVLHAGLLCCVASARGQGVAYPTKPIRFVVPQTPSGQVDTVGRVVAQHLAERLGQPLIVEQREAGIEPE